MKKRGKLMNKKKCLQTVSLIILIMCLGGCKKSEQTSSHEKSFLAMDTYMTLSASGENAENALERAEQRITQLEKLLSVTDKDSEVYKLNSSQGSYIEVSEDTQYLVSKAFEIYDMTNGAFNITLYPISKEWGFTTGDYRIPEKERINELLKITGYERILTDKKGMLSLEENTQIDLGGIAKGYAGYEAAKILKEEGITSGLLNMGGNIQTVGSKLDGSDWKVGIKDPSDESKLIGSVAVSDMAVITSGAYERYFEKEGHIYGHIIDPLTGYPTDSGIISVSVIGSDGTLCDALSTSLFVMGIEDSKSFLEAHRDVDAVIVTNDNTLYATKNIISKFTPMGKYENSDIKEI